jgi:hypothetical protein
MPLSERQLTQTLQQVLGLARKLEPKAQVFVSLDSARQAHVRFSRNEVTTSGEIDQGTLFSGRRPPPAPATRPMTPRCARWWSARCGSRDWRPTIPN